MRISIFMILTATFSAVAMVQLASPAYAQNVWPFNMPEQRTVRFRDPSQLAPAHLPDSPTPATVSNPPPAGDIIQLSLDDAIRIALENSEVVRVLTGVAASSSGRTIYDPAITNTLIDQEQGRFDPTLKANNSWNRLERPNAIFDPMAPSGTALIGPQLDDYNLNAGVSKTTTSGGTANLGINTNPVNSRPGIFPLNPQNRASLDLSFTQPLLQGGGFRVNMAPIVIARIDTERSYFQMKDGMQELVRSTIDAYWQLVFARVNQWAREQQLEQAKFIADRAEARLRAGIADLADVTQTRTAYNNFRANLITADANVLQREAAFRNIVGLPAATPARIIPLTPPTTEKLISEWNNIRSLAEERRPDVVELKLIIEADEQRLLMANNTALPRADAVALYRWNGLEGETPGGIPLSTRAGQFTDWTLGVNFSVPLGLRSARAGLRQQELLIARDRANLQQGLHNASHILAGNLRNLAQFYEQYEAFQQTRDAARLNLEQQLGEYRSGRQFLNVLQAISDWGNAVSSEAQALTQYNTELANLERQTGTILETHGVRFYEERYGSIGPLGRFFKEACYPERLPPTDNDYIYPSGEKPADQFFDLKSPVNYRSLPKHKPEALPQPNPLRQNGINE